MSLDTIKLLAVTMLYAAVSGCGLYLLKVNLPALPSLNINLFIGGGLYIASFLVWLWMLKQYPISIIFPLATGLLIVVTQFLGVVLGEVFPVNKIIGVGVIMLGIVLLSFEVK